MPLLLAVSSKATTSAQNPNTYFHERRAFLFTVSPGVTDRDARSSPSPKAMGRTTPTPTPPRSFAEVLAVKTGPVWIPEKR